MPRHPRQDASRKTVTMLSPTRSYSLSSILVLFVALGIVASTVAALPTPQVSPHAATRSSRQSLMRCPLQVGSSTTIKARDDGGELCLPELGNLEYCID